MIFGSVCSGIEAASVAWHPLGWRAAWLAEIEQFPSAVLAHHYPEVPNLGDMTKLADMVANDNIEAPDVLVGGTPCQAFSVAGARKGLADDRGFLSIKFVGLADAIDSKRADNDNEPAIIVWENVPGVLSSKDNAFGAFLGLLAGEDCELQPPRGKWSNAGYVRGPKRTIAWRILDAQYFGVAQRRRRVFVVASARKGFDPAAVLFESEGVRRDSAPCREAQEVVAALTANGVGTCGADDNQGQAGHLISHSVVDVSPTLRAGGNQTGGDRPPGTDVDTCETLQVVGSLTAKGPATNGAPEVDAGHIFPFRMTAISEYVDGDVGSTLKAIDYKEAKDLVTVVHGTQDPIVADNMAHCLGRNSGQENAVAYGIPGNWIGRAPENGGNATEPMHDVAPCQTVADRHGVAYGMKVRRLTPTECERLQGFPDGYTLVPVGKKQSADGPRYKALGNSMAVPCMAWIGKRIQMQLSKADNDNKKLQGALCQ